VLGQQAGPEATATKGHLRRSEAARSWTRSLLDSLEQFYEDGSVPAIPDGERGRRAGAAPARAPRQARDDSVGGGRLAAVGDPVMRRRLLAGLAALALVLVAVLVWPVGVLTGDDDEGGSADGGQAAQTGGQGQQAGSGQPAGIAIVVEQDGKKQLLVQAANLAPSGQSEGYYVWLYNSRGDAKSLGGQVTDQQGNYQAIGALPADFGDYGFIDVTRQQVANEASVRHSGESVLRGRVPKLRKAQAQGNQPAALGQTVLRPPS
jgi:hypothetical protein